MWSLRIVLSLTALVSIIVLPTNSKAGVLSICIQNCGQCKKMYGDFFLGPLCAEECLETLGRSTPDCNKLTTINRFLGPSRRQVNLRSQKDLARYITETRLKKYRYAIPLHK